MQTVTINQLFWLLSCDTLVLDSPMKQLFSSEAFVSTWKSVDRCSEVVIKFKCLISVCII